jgi:signal-transduction protein with cAMP-binding, CBS, and nucleotidyltransferase domain
MITAEDILKEKGQPIVSVPFDETVHGACLLMARQKIGAVLVEKNGQLVGIWTERDLLRGVAKNILDDPMTNKVGDYMTVPLITAPHGSQIHSLKEMFLGLFIRHLIIEKDGRYIGFISIGDVIRAELIEKDRQAREMRELVSWEYYENWRWGRKKNE